MTPDVLIAKALEAREQWVDLGGGKRVKVRRPPAAELFVFGRGATPEQFMRCAVGWEGVTEADILGAAVGSDSAVPWSLDLWLVLALDNPDWMTAVSASVVEAIRTYLDKREAIGKNSQPS
jgi:hypothetical protein